MDLISFEHTDSLFSMGTCDKHTESDAAVMFLFFQARPWRTQMEKSQLFLMRQVHCRSCDKN